MIVNSEGEIVQSPWADKAGAKPLVSRSQNRVSEQSHTAESGNDWLNVFICNLKMVLSGNVWFFKVILKPEISLSFIYFRVKKEP